MIGDCVRQGGGGEGGEQEVWDGGVFNSGDRGLVVEVGGERVQRAVEGDIAWAEG